MSRPVIAIGALIGMTALSSCAPSARALRGAPTPMVLPKAMLSAQPTILRFDWTYRDETFEATGEGAVRQVGPDRARLDFFLKNGIAGGYAILVADSLEVPGIDLVRRFLPPVPLLWASLGRLALPSTVDTVIRVAGDTVRADLGALRGRDASAADGRAWRVAYAGDALVRVDRIEDGRIVEWMSRRRRVSGHWELQYVHERARRRLAIVVNDTTTVEGFDESIWRRP